MNDNETWLADTIYQAVQNYSRHSERSQQSAGFRFGVSDLGWCAEKSRRMLDQQTPDDEDLLTAFIGTAIGHHVELALKETWPSAILQAEVEVELFGDVRTYHLTGHPDVILPDEGILVDGKTTFGLNTVRRTGPSAQQQYQRHIYALAAHQAGLFGNLPLEQVQVANVWLDRSGQEKALHVQAEPYDPDVVYDATSWLDDVVYAYLQGEEARKEPPREVCAATCGFFRTCRAYDTDVSGRIEDPAQVTAVALYAEAMQLERTARQLKDEAKENLKGVDGNTDHFSVRWVHINETEIKPGIRRAHDKLEIRKLK